MVRLDLSQLFDKTAIPIVYAVIVLNQTINSPWFDHLYQRATVKICADGGYNRLQSWVKDNERSMDYYQPDYVIGDLDSLDLSQNAHHKPEIIKIHDQDRNDLQKSLDYIIEEGPSKVDAFVIFGPLGGRFDHELQSLSVLYQYEKHRICYLNEASLVTLLATGRSTIKVDSNNFGKHCGYAPMKTEAIISTEGFKWDVSDQSKDNFFVHIRLTLNSRNVFG